MQDTEPSFRQVDANLNSLSRLYDELSPLNLAQVEYTNVSTPFRNLETNYRHLSSRTFAELNDQLDMNEVLTKLIQNLQNILAQDPETEQQVLDQERELGELRQNQLMLIDWIANTTREHVIPEFPEGINMQQVQDLFNSIDQRNNNRLQQIELDENQRVADEEWLRRNAEMTNDSEEIDGILLPITNQVEKRNEQSAEADQQALANVLGMCFKNL